MDRPLLPPARPVELPGRGQTWVYDSGPTSRGRLHNEDPAILLLHGWTSTAALNWFRCFAALADRYRVVALDHRGHGQGIRSHMPFRLEDCADDAAALVGELDLGAVVAVGYSMGGPVAQLMWRRHRQSVAGLVLCATGAHFPSRRDVNGLLASVGLGASVALSMMPDVVRRQGMQWATRAWTANNSPAAWAVEEWGRHDLPSLIQAGIAIGRFDSTRWIGEIDVPTAVVITTEDSVVPPRRQLRLVTEIPGAIGLRVAGDHRACVDNHDQFVPALLTACVDVAQRHSCLI
jgi:pimeloyl-ACP methyl ester carboxylesterase